MNVQEEKILKKLLKDKEILKKIKEKYGQNYEELPQKIGSKNRK